MDVQIQRDLFINNDRFSALYETRHGGGVVAMTAVHRMDFAHRIGGARMVLARAESDSARCRSEVAHLAAAMTDKNAAAALPCDGQKTIILCPEGVPRSYEARAQILTEHIAAVSARDEGVIFGPDIAVPEAVQDILAAPGARTAPHVTGISRLQGGLSIDANGYTAFGLLIALDAVSARIDLSRGATVQGFGAVGAHVARGLRERSIPVRAVSTQEGALIAEGGRGLDIPRLWELREAVGDGCVAQLAAEGGGRFDPDPDALLSVPAAVFLPAARTCVLATQQELDSDSDEISSASPRSVEAWQEAVGAEVVLEGANHPLTPQAESWLADRGVIILPDFLVNCGGLIGCLVEWAFREDLRADPAAFHDIDAAARRYIAQVIRNNTAALREEAGSPRESANTLATQRRSSLLQRWPEVAASGRGPQAINGWLRGLLAGG